jgi:hypothetical protein
LEEKEKEIKFLVQHLKVRRRRKVLTLELKLTNQISDSDSSLPVCCHANGQCSDAEAYDKRELHVQAFGSHEMLTFWC